MYALSRDYKKLFELICSGEIALGFVDYTRGGGDPCRDPVSIERIEPYRIGIWARGISYGSVYPFDKDKASEEDLFLSACRSCNLEWVDPANAIFCGSRD